MPDSNKQESLFSEPSAIAAVDLDVYSQAAAQVLRTVDSNHGPSEAAIDQGRGAIEGSTTSKKTAGRLAIDQARRSLQGDQVTADKKQNKETYT